jgi:hypothetical protein
MDMRYFNTFAGISLILGALGCEQPPVECQSAHGAFAAKYTLVEGEGDCAEVPGGVLGVSTYWQPGLVDGRGRPIAPDLTTPSIAIRPEEIGLLQYQAAGPDEDPAHQPHAVGDFADHRPTDDGFCTAPTLAPAEQDLTLLVEVPPEEPVEPLPEPEEGEEPPPPPEPVFEEVPTSVRYGFEDVKFYVTPAAVGSQMTARMVYERDGCTAVYDVDALFPAVPCGAPDPEDETGATMFPDATLCSPSADPENGRATGSGINPDFDVTCDAQLLLCVLNQPVPSLR